MDLQPKFVKPDDFLNMYGIDLEKKLRPSDKESEKATIFLWIVEDRMKTYIDVNTFRNYDWDQVLANDSDREYMQKAILTQAYYVFRNSDIATDSGYDPDRGIIADKGTLDSIAVASVAIDYLKACGLWNLNISNRRRYIDFR